MAISLTYLRTSAEESSFLQTSSTLPFSGHDKSLKATEDGQLALREFYNIVSRIVEEHLGIDDDIAFCVLLPRLIDPVPGTYVGPAKLTAGHADVLAFLQDAVVD